MAVIADRPCYVYRWIPLAYLLQFTLDARPQSQ